MVRQNGNEFISEIDGDAGQAIDGRVGLLVQLLIGVSVMIAFDVVALAERSGASLPRSSPRSFSAGRFSRCALRSACRTSKIEMRSPDFARWIRASSTGSGALASREHNEFWREKPGDVYVKLLCKAVIPRKLRAT